MTTSDDRQRKTSEKAKEGTPSRENQCDDVTGYDGLGVVRGEGEGDRTFAIATDDADLSGGDPRQYDKFDDGGTTLKKIISQLQELQQEHLAYVKAHEDRLEQRLKENRAHQGKVMDKMEQLEQDAKLYLAQLQQEGDRD